MVHSLQGVTIFILLSSLSTSKCETKSDDDDAASRTAGIFVIVNVFSFFTFICGIIITLFVNKWTGGLHSKDASRKNNNAYISEPRASDYDLEEPAAVVHPNQFASPNVNFSRMAFGNRMLPSPSITLPTDNNLDYDNEPQLSTVYPQRPELSPTLKGSSSWRNIFKSKPKTDNKPNFSSRQNLPTFDNDPNYNNICDLMGPRRDDQLPSNYDNDEGIYENPDAAMEPPAFKMHIPPTSQKPKISKKPKPKPAPKTRSAQQQREYSGYDSFDEAEDYEL